MIKSDNKIKFIVRNYTTQDIDDKRLFELAYLVILNGKISNDNTEYCYLTTFKDGNVVSTRKTKSGYRFDIYNDDRVKKELKKVGDR